MIKSKISACEIRLSRFLTNEFDNFEEFPETSTEINSTADFYDDNSIISKVYTSKERKPKSYVQFKSIQAEIDYLHPNKVESPAITTKRKQSIQINRNDRVI